MTLALVRNEQPPRRVEIGIPDHLWQRLQEMTPNGTVQTTILRAITDFVEQEAVNKYTHEVGIDEVLNPFAK